MKEKMGRFKFAFALVLMMVLPRLAAAQFEIVSPSLPVVSGTYAFKLDVPATVWWTKLCIDEPLSATQPSASSNCPVAGYNPLLWDSTKVADGDHNMTAYGYSQGGTVPVDIVSIVTPAPTTVSGTVPVVLGNIASNVWWTRLCIDGSTNCPAVGDSTLNWNTSATPNGIHMLTVFGYAQNGTTPIGSQSMDVNLQN